MRVLVTGSAGFIGRHVSKALADRGHDVIGMDILLGHDITKPLPTVAGLDAVVHLAAVASPRECDASPTKAFDVNVNGTLQVLKLAVASGAKKVVFTSSAHVYGVGPRYLPTDECHPLSLGNTYTTTKILGEELCRLYHDNHGLSYTVLRLFNAYGPGQSAGYFIPDMLAKGHAGRIEIKGGDTTKDFVHIDDVARAFVQSVESVFVGAINIGTGVETSLETIVRRMAESAHVDWLAYSGAGDATRMRADIRRAKRVLGWEPRIALEEGLDTVLGEAKVPAVY